MLNGIERSRYDEIRLGLDYAEIALENGDADEAEAQAREALAAAIAGQACRPSRSAASLLVGRALEARGQYDEAITRLEEVVTHGDGLPRLEAGIALSRCLREAGDLSLAIEVGEQLEAAAAGTLLADTEEAVQALGHHRRGVRRARRPRSRHPPLHRGDRGGRAAGLAAGPRVGVLEREPGRGDQGPHERRRAFGRTGAGAAERGARRAQPGAAPAAGRPAAAPGRPAGGRLRDRARAPRPRGDDAHLVEQRRPRTVRRDAGPGTPARR
ncbi:hypothetical protein G5V59_03355 [Nocardioides sp. W3-2-3]|nr:hypothetical protein [Nocardioides convexus]